MNFELPQEGKVKLKSLPDIARPLRLLLLRDKLSEVSERTIFGMSIQVALHKGPMDKQLLEEIYSQWVDNNRMVEDVVGSETISLIREILHK